MSNFKIVCLRTHNTDDKNALGIYKILKPNTDYFFYDDYEVDDRSITKKPFGDFDLYGDVATEPRINVCAVVGENGSGKSALIELMMRAINNFACCVVGEYKLNPVAVNLIFVDHVYSTLYFLKDDVSYALEAKGRSVVLYETHKGGQTTPLFGLVDDTTMQVKDTVDPVYNVITIGDEILLSGYGTPANKKDVLKDFFYTVVNNFSHYAYNTDDFSNENCKPTKVAQIRELIQATGATEEADRCWLKGIFHKNDGYVTPIVLSPFRQRGNIDINDERHFAKQRLLWLSLYTKNGTDFPFRAVDNKQELFGCKLKFTGFAFEDDEDETQSKEEKMMEDLVLNFYDNYPVSDEPKTKELLQKKKNDQIKQFEGLCGKIFGQWVQTLDDIIPPTDRESIKTEYWYEALKDYIAFKTIKISKNYNTFREFYNRIGPYIEKASTSNDQIDGWIAEYIKELTENPSHITQKLFRALAFLQCQQIDQKVLNEAKNDYTSYTFEQIDKDIKQAQLYADKQMKTSCLAVGAKLFSNSGSDYKCTEWDLLPPSIFDYELVVRNTDTGDLSDFNKLSSGQRQLLYGTSSVLYHLVNLNSVPDDHPSRPAYGEVCVVLEEVELYYHPELQRKMVKLLVDGIRTAGFERIKGVQLIFLTHSPFILSDIPSSNCLLLDNKGLPRKEKDKKELKTFGANVFDILRSGFFLEKGFIGEFALDKINAVSRTVEPCANDRKLIALVDDPYVRAYLEEKLGSQVSKCERIQELEEKLEQLRKECRDEQN